MEECAPLCPHLQAVLRLLGERWTGLVIAALMEGPLRFCQVARRVEGVSDRLLSQRLKVLERNGLVERRVALKGPVQVIYALTPKGKALQRVVEALHGWAQQWEEAETPSHKPGR